MLVQRMGWPKLGKAAHAGVGGMAGSTTTPYSPPSLFDSTMWGSLRGGARISPHENFLRCATLTHADLWTLFREPVPGRRLVMPTRADVENQLQRMWMSGVVLGNDDGLGSGFHRHKPHSVDLSPDELELVIAF